MQTLDQSADTQGVQLAKLSHHYEFPSFVKTADFTQVMTPTNLERNVYADYYNKEFPCHTKAATWVSAMYFFENRGDLNPKQASAIEQRLQQFADYHRIRNAYNDLKQQHQSLHKEAALSDDQYAYVWVGEDGNVQRQYPLRNPLEVKEAANWFHTYRDHWIYSDRRKIATRILKRANDYGAQLPPVIDLFLRKQAGEGIPDPREVVVMLNNRAHLTNNPDLKAGVTKLAHTVQTQPAQTLAPAQLEKLAEVVDQIDRTIGLVGKYTDTVPRPEDVIFRNTYKEATGFVSDCCTLTNGSIYNKPDFKRVKLSEVQALFGDSFASEIRSGLDVDPEKFAQLAHTLPRGEADMLDRLLSDHAITPLGKQAAMSKVGFSKEQLQGLASLQQ